MTKKLQDLQAVKVSLDELQTIPFSDTMNFLMKASVVEEALRSAITDPETDEEKALAQEVKDQWVKIQIAFEQSQG